MLLPFLHSVVQSAGQGLSSFPGIQTASMSCSRKKQTNSKAYLGESIPGTPLGMSKKKHHVLCKD